MSVTADLFSLGAWLVLVAAFAAQAQTDLLESWGSDNVRHLSEDTPPKHRFDGWHENFHLVLEYKRGEHTWGPRADAARLHRIELHDKTGTVARVELVEGDAGRIALPPFAEPDPRKSGIKGTRSADDPENPLGEWNRLEIIRKKGHLQTRLNGQARHDTALPDGARQLSFATVGAAIAIRRMALLAPGKQPKPWVATARSTDTGYSETGATILPRPLPWNPERSRAAWQIDGDYEMQLVASEPLVCDPADIAWDRQGRMYVAEMRDYPFPPEHGPRLSRIRRLTDRDGDGRMDEAITWADQLPDVQGLLPFENGLLITCASGVMQLRDTTGDGRADQRTMLLEVNAPRHSQLQISSPRWRLDGLVHLNNGIDGKEIRRPGADERALAFRGRNLRYDPASGALTPVPGVGQFGATHDDFGRSFFCSNRNPAMFEVLPLVVLGRNPKAGIQKLHEDIQPAASKVYPLELSHTTAAAHAGTHTSACGLTIYRGTTMPDLRGDLFVCDPTSQLVTRNRLRTEGASLRAQRVGERRDFLVSADEWSRPVMLRNGPDGALYICDMYRRFIDHAVYFPKPFTASNYMRAGVDHGRIWRLAPKGKKPGKVRPMPETASELVAELESKIAWRREQAQQQLQQEKLEPPTTTLLSELLTTSESPLARAHALWVLEHHNKLADTALLQRLNDPTPGVLEQAIRLTAERKLDPASHLPALLVHDDARVRMLAAAWLGPNATVADLATLSRRADTDDWTLIAVASISPETPGRVLAVLLETGAPIPAATLTELARRTAQRADTTELAAVLDPLTPLDARSPAERAALVSGLAAGLKRSPLKSLSALAAKPPPPLADRVTVLKTALAEARERCLDPARPLPERLAALKLVDKNLLPLVEQLIRADHPPPLQQAACRALAQMDRKQVTAFYFEQWPSLAPTPRREALTYLTRHSESALQLMQAMKAGDISPALMPAMNRWSFSRSSNKDLREISLELFGPGQSDRDRVVAEYQAALASLTGDPEKGRAVFTSAACATCHSMDGKNQIGPTIRDVRNKPPAAIVAAILHPNQVVEDRWIAYTVTTRSGEILAGLVSAEDFESVQLSMPGGLQRRVPRRDIASFAATGRSLMPEGLEAAIDKQQMADLIAFLKQ